ncbi:hypothetical protein F5B22DRAFT_660917 [Xylaria bambusicola]|uniref:uncharacterized protein n=1 Tax=Xylaria bambusicola TaxID=326684 RepID=UPI00200771B0|nr:uncharacterized protein F5B22DRAFT_660917 [Xylaria bambusicola]KAI0505889.1 hypothetical protein F5B22DRAFT_660917 [Xylaria bambusicola]
MDNYIRHHLPYSTGQMAAQPEAQGIRVNWQREALEEKLPDACIEANQPREILKAVTEHFLCMAAIQLRFDQAIIEITEPPQRIESIHINQYPEGPCHRVTGEFSHRDLRYHVHVWIVGNLWMHKHIWAQSATSNMDPQHYFDPPHDPNFYAGCTQCTSLEPGNNAPKPSLDQIQS